MQGGLKLAWQISVSVLLLVAPFALASQEDMAIAMEEKQMMMQQSANEVSVIDGCGVEKSWGNVLTR